MPQKWNPIEMSSTPSDETEFTVEWLIAAVVLWVVSAGCATLMLVLKATESRYLNDDSLVGAVGLMLAQHVMTLAVCGITFHRNRLNRAVTITAVFFGLAAVVQAVFLSSLLFG